jgi:ribonuclease I
MLAAVPRSKQQNAALIASLTAVFAALSGVWFERDLGELMPGMGQGLHEHGWREHGGCSGLDGGEYFRHVELGRAIDASLLPALTTVAGREASAEELCAAADAREAGLGATLTFHCRVPRGEHGRPWLEEVRQCVGKDAENVPLSPVSCASVDRRDTGCGARFFVPEHS